MSRRLAGVLVLGWALGTGAASAQLCQHTAPAQSPFAVRGIKGLWWPGLRNYERALPWLARHDMNFLMLCYSSFPASGSRWREDYTPEELAGMRRLATQGDRAGVQLCLSFNPGLWSNPPLQYGNETDYELAWRKVRTVHSCGVRWFALCLDDISRQLEPADVRRFGTLQAAQVHFVNRLWRDMKALRPRPRLIFCPSVYLTADARAHLDYITAVGAGIDREVMMFWTGPACCSSRITARDAREFGRWIRRKPFIWDNYPVNDMFSWRPLVGPLKARSADLGGAVAGYLANPMKQWGLSRLPLATTAAYLHDPTHYDPARAVQTVVKSHPETERATIRRLFALYGNCFWGEPGFPPRPASRDSAEAARLLAECRLLRDGLQANLRLKRLCADLQPALDEDIRRLDRQVSRLATDPLRLVGDDLTGGAAEVFGGTHHGRNVNYVYARSSGRHTMQGEFHLAALPAHGATLRLVACGDDYRTQPRIRISLNGRAIVEGKCTFPPDDFREMRFSVPLEALQVGPNVLVVSNLEEQGPLGMPPWFMVAEAELVTQ